MDADAVDWGIRVAVVFLFIGGSYSLYINGVAYGWWHAWGEKPTVAATTTPAARPSPSVSSEPAMSGGYEIGPDGVLRAPTPSTPPRPTPNPNYPKKPKKTQNEEQNSPPNTSSIPSPMHGTPETHSPSQTSQNQERTFERTYIQNIEQHLL